jgi:hypothetical protein
MVCLWVAHMAIKDLFAVAFLFGIRVAMDAHANGRLDTIADRLSRCATFLPRVFGYAVATSAYLVIPVVIWALLRLILSSLGWLDYIPYPS